MGADLGHEKDLVAPAPQGPAEPVLGPAVPVFPAVIAERDAGIDGFMNEPDRLLHRFEVTQVMTADPQGGDLDASAAERPHRDFAFPRVVIQVRHGLLLFVTCAAYAACFFSNN